MRIEELTGKDVQKLMEVRLTRLWQLIDPERNVIAAGPPRDRPPMDTSEVRSILSQLENLTAAYDTVTGP